MKTQTIKELERELERINYNQRLFALLFGCWALAVNIVIMGVVLFL